MQSSRPLSSLAASFTNPTTTATNNNDDNRDDELLSFPSVSNLGETRASFEIESLGTVTDRDSSPLEDHGQYAAYDAGFRPGSVNVAPAVGPKDVSRSSRNSSASPAPREQAWYFEDNDKNEGTSFLDEDKTPRISHQAHFSQVSVDLRSSRAPSRGRSHEDIREDGHLTRPRLEHSATSFHTAYDSPSDHDQQDSDVVGHQSRPKTMSPGIGSQRPPNLLVSTANSAELRGPESKKKSPGITGFFGWRKGSNNNPESPSPTTTFSNSRSVSPRPPSSTKTHNKMGIPDGRPSSPILGESTDYFSQADSYYGLPSPANAGPQNFTQIDALVQELREVSAELAASIRREMELEDEVEKHKSDKPAAQSVELSRRTSDYYSDSGVGSMPLPLADSHLMIETLERKKRKVEQEKARLKLILSQKAQEELEQKRALELHIQSLEEQLRMRSTAESQAEESESEKTRELEASLEDTKRRLTEERQFKENFEDLLAGMRQEIESHRAERDALRDLLVPQLRSRVEDLEAQAAEAQNLTNENVKMQQENQSLRNENQTLANARRLQLDLQQTNARFKSIAEEDEPGSPRSPGSGSLSRSNSLAMSKSVRRRSGSISRTKEGLNGVEATPDSLKDLEDQRDALHRTLKALILRHDHITLKHEKQVRALQIERDRALTERKRRAAFQFEIQHLRNEMNSLKRRADDAMEQKWQCEKGLSGLKMDLDRAQQETTSLKGMVDEKDELGPYEATSSSDNTASEQSLNTAYSNLREIHASSVARLQSQSQGSDMLDSSSQRMQSLSQQVEDQLSTNTGLRERLREAIERGVAEQEASATKITNLETALRAAEERVLTAAHESEEAVIQHEDYARTMREAVDEQSRRGLVKSPLLVTFSPQMKRESSSGLGVALSPHPLVSLSPGLKTPLLTAKNSGFGNTSFDPVASVEVLSTETLQQRVSELERAASNADAEMQGVVEKMNRAQIEVALLQGERDEATRQTRRLQREIIAERERMKALTV